MKFLSYHPFSLYENGGGSRILRRLYQGHEDRITSLIVKYNNNVVHHGNIKEISVSVLPSQRKWHRWYLRNVVQGLREKVFFPITYNRIKNAASEIDFDIVHVVDHGKFSATLCQGPACSDKELWVSFHDHFSTSGSTFNNAKVLWNTAYRRLVISAELGNEYQCLFGARKYEIITDGLEVEEVSQPIRINQNPIIIYFSGLLHIDYLPLFQTLAESLDILSGEGLRFKLLLRGTQYIEFLSRRTFEVEYRPFTLNNMGLKIELDSASILYLPIKFAIPDFYLYSMSTKMIGYLGGSGTILYHGPADSAACKLLERTSSTVSCNSLKSSDLVVVLKKLLEKGDLISKNAKTLIQEQFNLSQIKKRFWQL